jgi:hypothetical protein
MLNRPVALTVAGDCSLFLALLHVAFVFAPASVLRFFGAPAWVLSGGPKAIGATLVVALGLGLFAAYAFSGAGRIRPLPLLWIGIWTIGAIYTLRGLLLLPQIVIALRQPASVAPRFLVFSLVSLVLGLLYLSGGWNRGPRSANR